MDAERKSQAAIAYIRAKVDQLLTVMGTQPLRAEELDDDTLLDLDPIGIVGDSFRQVIDHLNATNHQLSLARNEIRAILDALEAAVIVVNADRTIDDCNRLAREWFFADTPLEQLLGRTIQELCPCANQLHGLGDLGDRREIELPGLGRHYHVASSTINDEAGQPVKQVYLCFDVTAQKAAEASLQLYAKVFDHTGEGILITDPETRILKVNEALCRITGYAEDELLGKTPRQLRSGLHDPEFYAAMWRTIRAQGYWKGEIYDRSKDGRVISSLQTISEVHDGEGRLIHYVGVLTDISHLKETQDRLDYLAHHDVLTGLPNRLLCNARLTQAIERARRDGTNLALLFIDLDRFKNINDSLGHHVGDQLLVEVAQRLQRLLRQSDTVARLGGDEFVVLMEGVASQEEAVRLAQKIGSTLKQPFRLADMDLHIGCSIGITLYPDDGEDAATLLKNADADMYRAKEAGRDHHIRFSHDLSLDVQAKLALENALRKAVRTQAFVLHYQPIVDLDRGRTVAAEALIRWPSADGVVFISPEQFIPLAEETRLILPLGEWVLREALTQFLAWRKEGLDLDYISVNISAMQLAYPDFPDMLTGLLQDLGIAGHHLQVELTENVLMRDIDRCQPVLARLRSQGIRIAIDDFGTGYSSLAYLRQLPLDILKVDRSFVLDIPGDPNDCAIAAAIIGLARTLGLKAVAEGIETADQERYLREIGCDHVQGYRYARPLPAAAFLAYARGAPQTAPI
jgi:diguanylate cyclase (GGDEF)-like protein/PAS domain S-box-containing protein